MNTKITKKVYVRLIETYVRYGYDISELLNPTYKNIDAQKCLDFINQAIEIGEGAEVWEFEEKVTFENL